MTVEPIQNDALGKGNVSPPGVEVHGIHVNFFLDFERTSVPAGYSDTGVEVIGSMVSWGCLYSFFTVLQTFSSVLLLLRGKFLSIGHFGLLISAADVSVTSHY